MSLPNIDLKGNPFYLDQEAIDWVESTLNSMTKKQKIDHLFFPAVVDFSDDGLNNFLSVVEPSGVMYRPCTTEEAIEASNKLKRKCKIPPLIAANLEKGGNGIVKEGTQVGSPLAVAATDRVENAAHLAQVCAAEAKAVGANVAFAPIIDIDYNYRNPILNTRTFGSDPERVAAFGEAYTRTCQSNGVAVSIKHFPGDGRDDRDQHLVTTINDMSCEEWMETYGMCYKRSIAAGALTCMAGHIMQPAWQKRINPALKDEELLPASLSKELIGANGLLRGELGFNGVVITDATTMAGMLIPMERKYAVPGSIAAGADIFLFNRNLQEDLEYMHQGVEEGLLSMERVEEAVCRILALKAALGLHKDPGFASLETAKKVVGCEQHKQWAREVADQTITLVKEEAGVLPLDVTKRRILLCPLEQDGGYQAKVVAVTTGGSGLFKKLLEDEGFEVTIFESFPLFEGSTPRCDSYSEDYDYIIYLANYSTKSNQTTVRIEWAQPMGANCPSYVTAVPTIFISIENPYHLQDVPRVKTYINTYCGGEFPIQAVVDKLMGRSEFKGKSPVDAFCGRWDTHL